MKQMLYICIFYWTKFLKEQFDVRNSITKLFCETSFECQGLPCSGLLVTLHWKYFTSCQLRNSTLRSYLRSSWISQGYFVQQNEVNSKPTRKQDEIDSYFVSKNVCCTNVGISASVFIFFTFIYQLLVKLRTMVVLFYSRASNQASLKCIGQFKMQVRRKFSLVTRQNGQLLFNLLFKN